MFIKCSMVFQHMYVLGYNQININSLSVSSRNFYYFGLNTVKVLSSGYFEISNKLFLASEISTLLCYKTIVVLSYCTFTFINYPYLPPSFLHFLVIAKYYSTLYVLKIFVFL